MTTQTQQTRMVLEPISIAQLSYHELMSHYTGLSKLSNLDFISYIANSLSSDDRTKSCDALRQAIHEISSGEDIIQILTHLYEHNSVSFLFTDIIYKKIHDVKRDKTSILQYDIQKRSGVKNGKLKLDTGITKGSIICCLLISMLYTLYAIQYASQYANHFLEIACTYYNEIASASSSCKNLNIFDILLTYLARDILSLINKNNRQNQPITTSTYNHGADTNKRTALAPVRPLSPENYRNIHRRTEQGGGRTYSSNRSPKTVTKKRKSRNNKKKPDRW